MDKVGTYPKTILPPKAACRYDMGEDDKNKLLLFSGGEYHGEIKENETIT